MLWGTNFGIKDMEAAEESIQLILMLPVMVDLFCFVPVRAD